MRSYPGERLSAQLVRNFCIIAHIDHGKSTLADRFLDITGTLPKKEMNDQVLDDMDLERERGITIKAHAITMHYHSRDGKTYRMNLIDTPGHVDFSYEVSRSLAACEGALLLIDASQGVEAQTLSNLFMALEHNLTILTVLNKIDLPNARVDEVRGQIQSLLGQTDEEILLVSAREGIGVEGDPRSGRARDPSPAGESGGAAARADLRFHLRSVPGSGAPTCGSSTGRCARGTRSGSSRPGRSTRSRRSGSSSWGWCRATQLEAGDVGYIVAGIKIVADAKVGDTVAHARDRTWSRCPGYKPMKPMVYSGLFPVDTEDYLKLKEALGKFQLNDAALVYEPETSLALGFGFRGGFLGPLHIEIVVERLRREYDLDLIATSPTVPYLVFRTDGTRVEVDSPAQLPDRQRDRADSRSRSSWRRSSRPSTTSETS